MSAYQVFQNAYLHAQLARPPDEEHTFPSGTMDMDEWDKLPPDCQAFIEILAHYGMDDDVGLFIYKYYPEVAARIGPTLRTGLIILEEKHITEELPMEFIDNYVTELAQIAIDGLENHTAPVTPETESKNTAMIRATAEAILEQAPARARISLRRRYHRAKVQTCHNVPSTILYNQLTKARANEKRLTIVNPRQQCYAMSKIPSVCILESP